MEVKIKISNLEDRLAVANVLVKNGYTVRLSKERKPGKGNQYSYFVVAEKEESNES